MSLSGPSEGKETQPPTLPHDRILANLFDQGQAKAGSLSRPPALDANDPIYDPFDGSFLGSLVAPDHNVQPEEYGKLNDVAAKNEELWSHLSRVLELQNQISAMHLDMEEIGMSARDPKGKGKGTRSRATSVSRVVIDDAEGDEGIGGKRDEEAEKNKAREEQFSNLSGQFRGKKEAIDGIMLKLDSLSRAVTEFHALQAPKVDFHSSRNTSLPVTNIAPEPVGNPTHTDMRSHIDPASTPPSLPTPSITVLKRADEYGTQYELVDSPISTLVSLPP